MELEFHKFPLNRANEDAWDSLLALNGGKSAPWITEAPGINHQLYVCCLVLRSDPPPRQKLEGEDIFVELMFKDQEWSAYYSRIAILVPVAVQNGIGMAQGIKRLSITCPCHNLKRLAVNLLAHSVRHFSIEYLFLSPIQPFRKHLESELNSHGVIFGEVGYKSLCWALHHTELNDEDRDPANTWVDIRFSKVKILTAEGKIRNRDAVLLTITPQLSDSHANPRELLLNEGFYLNQCEVRDPGYRAPPPLPETYDFLWFIAGDGVMVVHGPSLQRMACPA